MSTSTLIINKSSKSMYLTFYFVIVLFLFIKPTIEQSNGPQTSIQCVLEDKITPECILNINQNSLQLIQQQPTYSVLLCPIFVKFFEENQQYRKQLWDNTQKVCKLSVQANGDNGYLLLGLYVMEQRFIDLLQLEYGLFFREPFSHQRKFKEILQKYSKYFNQNKTTGDNQPNSTYNNFSIAIKLFYQNNLPQSLTYLNTVSPFSYHKLNNLLIFLTTRVLEKSGQFPTALQLLQKNITQAGKTVHWYFHHLKGNLLMHHLLFRQAIRSFQQALNIKTTELGQKQFLFSLYNIGVCYQKVEDFSKSVTYFKMVIDRQEAAQALNSLGFSYYSLIDLSDANKKINNNNYIKQAQKMYKRAIKADHKYFIAYYNYATLLYDIGKYQLAKQYYSLSISQNNTPSSSLSSKYGLFKSLYKINKNKGLEYLQNNIIVIKDVPSIYGDVGALFHQLNEKLQAKKYLQKAIVVGHNLGEVFQQKGVVEFQLGLNQQALESFLKALEYGNIKSSVWFNLGYLYQLNDNYQKALGLYKKSLEKDPYSPAKQQIKQVTIKMKNNKKQQL